MSGHRQHDRRSSRGVGRNIAAFEALLASEEEEAPRQRPGKGGKRHSKGEERVVGFRLRDEEPRARAAGGSTASDAAQLQELFGSSLPADLIQDVYNACGRDMASTTDALLGLASGGEGAGQDGATASASAASAQAAAPAAVGPCYWDELPRECKEAVFACLSLRELAKAARACREWAQHVRAQRSGLRAVRVPRDVTHTALRGLVAAFANASEVDLSRWRDALKGPHNFDAAFTATALGEGDRLTGVPVSALSLARCGHMTDADVQSCLSALPHLVRLDLSHCPQLKDGALNLLARYSRQVYLDDEGWREGEEEEEATQEQLVRLALGRAGGYGATTPRGSGTAAPAGAAGPQQQQQQHLESPSTAVRRIAAQLRSRQAAAADVAAARRSSAAGLEELALRGASITAKGVKALLQPGSATAKSLQVLDVSGCPNLGGEALDVPPRAALRVLRAGGCNALRSVVIQLPNTAPLEELVLDGCRQLQEVLVVAPRLRSLSVSHCGVLHSLALRCRGLTHLAAVNCSTLNLGAGGALFDCPRLQSLNLFGCRQLNAEGMEAVAGSCAALTSLELSGCIALSRLLLPDTPALQRVALNGCSLLRLASLAAPQLRELRAKGCTRLMEVRLFTSVLHVLDLENCENVREVALLEPSTHPGSVEEGHGQPAPGGEPTRELVLRGCTALPPEVKQRLRAAVPCAS